MKRFWLILLSLGLIVAFSTSAMAVDVKFSGEYYAAGLYMDRTNLQKNVAVEGPSTAFYFQRLRLNTTFIVSPGLTFTARADIMERAWGANRSASVPALDSYSAGTRAENENIAFDLAYITYVSPIGAFLAGYQIDGVWGTVFFDNPVPTGRLTYVLPIKGFTFSLMAGKYPGGENSATAINVTKDALASDRDSNFYTAFVKYAGKYGEVGFLYKFNDDRSKRNAFADAIPAFGPDSGFKTQTHNILPYFKAKFGPVALQGELIYTYGDLKYEGAMHNVPAAILALKGLPGDNAKLDQFSAWLDATADFGMFYVGGSGAYLPGDDFETTRLEGYNRVMGAGHTGGRDWNPCLIMFNSDYSYWTGSQAGFNNTANGGPMTNAYFLQARGGFRPIEKLDLMASVSWAHAVKTPAVVWEGSRDYGFEVDLTGTYKITNNLSYMLGAGYMFTGEWYKGVNSTPTDVNNNFMVINKLTLSF